MTSRKIAMLGGGFIGDFYVHALHGQRRTDLCIWSIREVNPVPGNWQNGGESPTGPLT